MGMYSCPCPSLPEEDTGMTTCPYHPQSPMARSTPDNPSPTGMREMDFLVESVPNLVHPSAPARGQNPWFGLLWPLLISGAGGMLCLWAAGFTLGLFLGGVLVAAI